MSDKAKSRLAIGLALVLALAAIAVLALMTWMTERATNFDPNPSNAAISDASAEAADADGFEAIDWGYWQDINPDIIGWITVPGTDIDYPVVQGCESDPDHYLSYDVYGSWNYHGVPYLNWKCAEGGLLGSGNALVFGHHLNDGTMFSKLASFSSVGYALEHSPILLQTPNGNAELSVLAVDVIDANRTKMQVEFEGEEEHTEWLSQVASNADLSFVGDDFDFSSVQNVVTLCTCSYNYWGNERTLVICSVELIE